MQNDHRFQTPQLLRLPTGNSSAIAIQQKTVHSTSILPVIWGTFENV